MGICIEMIRLCIKEIYYKIETKKKKTSERKEEANRIEQEKLWLKSYHNILNPGKIFTPQGNYEQAIYEFKLQMS